MANVSVSYSEMEAAGDRLTAGRADLEAQLTGLQRQIAALVASGYVTDSSSGAFRDSYDAFTAGCLQAVQGLDGMGAYLRAAAATFRDADQQLASAVAR